MTEEKRQSIYGILLVLAVVVVIASLIWSVFFPAIVFVNDNETLVRWEGKIYKLVPVEDKDD